MRTLMIATAAALLLGAAPARADEADGLDCNNAMTQRDMNICADKDYRAADRQLNAAYVRAMEGLDGRSRELLRTAQRNWIKFRDLECAYRAEQNEGGSIYPLVYSGCLTELTLARTKQLKAGQQ